MAEGLLAVLTGVDVEGREGIAELGVGLEQSVNYYTVQSEGRRDTYIRISDATAVVVCRHCVVAGA